MTVSSLLQRDSAVAASSISTTHTITSCMYGPSALCYSLHSHQSLAKAVHLREHHVHMRCQGTVTQAVCYTRQHMRQAQLFVVFNAAPKTSCSTQAHTHQSIYNHSSSSSSITDACQALLLHQLDTGYYILSTCCNEHAAAPQPHCNILWRVWACAFTCWLMHERQLQSETASDFYQALC